MGERPHIFVATHHKGGTVWMMTTFIRIAEANGWSFVQLNAGAPGWTLRADKGSWFEEIRGREESARPGCPIVFHDYHADIPDLTLCRASPGARGIHLVRDPRDMLLSAVRFHLKSDEPWLDEPNRQWGGRTFREKLSSYSSLEDRIAFEMDTHMGWVIEMMANFDHQGVFMDVKYEDLIGDHDMSRFHGVLAHLGLRGCELIKGLGAYWRSSLFGDRSDSDKQATAGHIFDSSAMQWRSDLDHGCVQRIEQRFGWAIDKLGYPLVG